MVVAINRPQLSNKMLTRPRFAVTPYPISSR
jgi:hypothetical protein